jgi:hypothetical protein
MKFSKELDLRFFQYLALARFKLSWRTYKPSLLFDLRDAPLAEGIGGLTLFTAADSGYLQRFIEPYLLSARAHVTRPRVHIHLYNPEEKDFELLMSMRGELPDMQITWSHEIFSPEAWETRSSSSDQQSWKSLYICTSRFLAAQAVQQRCGSDILMTDIDILFNGDVTKRFCAPADVGLFLRLGERNLCKRTLGGLVYASARPNGRKFLSHVADDISRFLAAGRYWFAFDQLALYRAVLRMPEASRRSHILELTTQDMSFDFSPDGLILVPKGRSRDEGRFAALSKKYSFVPRSNDSEPEIRL